MTLHAAERRGYAVHAVALTVLTCLLFAMWTASASAALVGSVSDPAGDVDAWANTDQTFNDVTNVRVAYDAQQGAAAVQYTVAGTLPASFGLSGEVKLGRSWSNGTCDVDGQPALTLQGWWLRHDGGAAQTGLTGWDGTTSVNGSASAGAKTVSGEVHTASYAGAAYVCAKAFLTVQWERGGPTATDTTADFQLASDAPASATSSPSATPGAASTTPAGGVLGETAGSRPASVSKRAVGLKGRVARVAVTCPSTDAAGTLRLTSATRVRVNGRRRVLSLGTASFTCHADATTRVALRLSHRNAKLVRRLHGLRARAQLTLRDGSGAVSRATARLTLKAS